MELSAVSAAADCLLLIRDDDPNWHLNIELQASRDDKLFGRLAKYPALIFDETGLATHTVLVLLRPAADHPGITGEVSAIPPNGRGGQRTWYDVVRIWERDVEEFLNGGLGILPLAPLARRGTLSAEEVVRRVEERVSRETGPVEGAELWTTCYVLAGLRYSAAVTAVLFRGVPRMRESSTYQVILQEGKAEGKTEGFAEAAHQLLLKFGEPRFGTAPSWVRDALGAITDQDTLVGLSDRLLSVESWSELFELP